MLTLLPILLVAPFQGPDAHDRFAVSPAALLAQTPEGDLRNAEQILARARGHEDREVRRHLYRVVEERAFAALERDPEDLDARWWLIAAKGLRVDEESARGKIRLAGVIHGEAERILAVDPTHPGAHHALARIHAGIMRLNPVVRYLAVRLVGEDTLRGAAWREAERHIGKAMEREPDVLVHRFERIRMLQSQERREEVFAELADLLALPDRAPMDPVVRERALRLQADLGS